MYDVRRPDDNELCGRVLLDTVPGDTADRGEQQSDNPSPGGLRLGGGCWNAQTVFGGHLGTHATRHDAEQQVIAEGLASLAERWTLIDSTSGSEEVVVIQEANTARVVLALGYYSMPEVPTTTISVKDLASGRWTLRR